MLDLRVFPDRSAQADALAREVADHLRRAVEDRGAASLALSGGTTPVAFFRRLAGIDLPWSAVTIFPVDERWVEVDDPDSNEGLIRTHLLRDRAAAARLVGMKTPAPTARQGEDECENRLASIPQPFDVLVLGMGNDGHTASLFPGADRLARATDPGSGRTCMALAPPDAPHERMSLTLPVILKARALYLLITGNEKRKTLEKALAGGPPLEMPIRLVINDPATRIKGFWAK